MKPFNGVLHNWWWNPHDHTISGDVYESPTWEDGKWITTSKVLRITTRKVCEYIQHVSMGEKEGYYVAGSTSKAYKITTRNSDYELGIPIVLALPKIVFEHEGQRHYLPNREYYPPKTHLIEEG